MMGLSKEVTSAEDPWFPHMYHEGRRVKVYLATVGANPGETVMAYET